MNTNNQKDLTANLTIEARIAIGTSADLHKAIDRVQREGSLIWVTREALTTDERQGKEFINRLEAINDIRPPVARMQGFGIDGAGTGYAVFPNLDGYSVTDGNIAVTEAERRFVACLRIIGRLHTLKITCGDITNSSFWVNRAGEIDFLGIMGLVAAPVGKDLLTTLPKEVQPYLAPELFTGQPLTARADVFSIGVLGYRLFMGGFPFQSSATNSQYNLADVPALSTKIKIPPVWAQEILMTCLEPDPSRRYSDANNVMQAIVKARELSISMQMAPATIGHFDSTKSSKPERSMIISAPIVAPKISTNKNSLNKIPTRLYLPIVVVLVCVLGFLVGTWLSNKNKSQIADTLLPQSENSFGSVSLQIDLDQVLEIVSADATSSDEKIKHLPALKDSDDPLAFHALIKMATQGDDLDLRAAAERVIVERGRRQGLILSSEQVKQWLRTLQNEIQTTDYANILKLVDKTLPIEDRVKLLRTAYVSHPELIVRLTAALAFDLDSLSSFELLLRQLVGDKLKIQNTEELSALALILADPDLALIFEDRINQRRDLLTDKDVAWLIEVLGKRMDVNTRAIANLALSRKLVAPLKAALLEIVRDRPDLKPEISAAIINAAVGVNSVADIQSLGRWYDEAAEPILLSIMAISKDNEVLAEAFDTISGKSPTIQPSAAIITWVRTNIWEARTKLAPVIGVLGRQALVSAEEQALAYKVLDDFVNNQELLDLLLAADAPELLRYILKYHSYRLTINNKLALLKHPMPAVRISALDAIDTNDVGALKMIMDSYNAEKDQAVKDKYKKFWVIKERQN